MVEAQLFTDRAYTYLSDEGINGEIVERMIALLRETWTRLLPDVRAVIEEQLRKGSCNPSFPMFSSVVYLWPVDHVFLPTYAMFWPGHNVFEFKPEVLHVFSDESIIAIFGHEFAHCYRSITDPESHRPTFLPTRNELKVKEDPVDSIAEQWGFAIHAAHQEEDRLRAEHPEVFARPGERRNNV